nr:hypothetical protein Iba_chr10aCG4780 [Ipomoea batatas]GMD43129.1 hypothetical protein Iba_chr10cCG2300 [Ipomoea batatas]
MRCVAAWEPQRTFRRRDNGRGVRSDWFFRLDRSAGEEQEEDARLKEGE